MTVNLTLAVLVGLLVGAGVTLLLARGIVRAFVGVLLIGNGVNLMFLIASGSPGRAPIVGDPALTDEATLSDPLPQAMALTAIVITLALTGFALALAHRSWHLQRTDLISDDAEDTRIHERAVANDLSDSDFIADAEGTP